MKLMNTYFVGNNFVPERSEKHLNSAFSKTKRKLDKALSGSKSLTRNVENGVEVSMGT